MKREVGRMEREDKGRERMKGEREREVKEGKRGSVGRKRYFIQTLVTGVGWTGLLSLMLFLQSVMIKYLFF